MLLQKGPIEPLPDQKDKHKGNTSQARMLGQGKEPILHFSPRALLGQVQHRLEKRMYRLVSSTSLLSGWNEHGDDDDDHGKVRGESRVGGMLSGQQP